MTIECTAPVCIGWCERVDLPDLSVRRLRAKIDTGARSSSLHVERQWRTTHAGAPWVGFALEAHRGQPPIEIETALFDEREVTDSGGARRLRPFIRSTLELAGIRREIELNLADRRGMRFAMLLGRSAMQGVFIVDPAGSYLHRKRRAS